MFRIRHSLHSRNLTPSIPLRTLGSRLPLPPILTPTPLRTLRLLFLLFRKHRQRHLILIRIHRHNAHLHLLSRLDHILHIRNKVDGKTGHVQQGIRRGSNIHKRSVVRNGLDTTIHHGSNHQIGEGCAFGALLLVLGGSGGTGGAVGVVGFFGGVDSVHGGDFGGDVGGCGFDGCGWFFGGGVFGHLEGGGAAAGAGASASMSRRRVSCRTSWTGTIGGMRSST
mmetsp:Transcript_19491/g.23222  ORF Transcript_19491/g.23222 Transcript_19491/m.23222 type:complete len:224 (-) Transcript_19491:389-1060(-)